MLSGSRNSRALRLVAAAGAVLLVLYFIYSWRNEALEKAESLSIAEAEYQALTKRFEKLTDELKDAVNRVSQLDEDLKVQQQSNAQAQRQLLNEKTALEKDCKREMQTLKQEKGELERDKVELIEQKDALKRDLDDTTTKLQKMTEDYNELSQTSKQEYAELQETCDEENNKCNDKLTSKEREVRFAQSDLLELRQQLAECHGTVSLLREKAESCHSQLTSHKSDGLTQAEQIRVLQDQLKKEQTQSQDILRELKLLNHQGGRADPLKSQNPIPQQRGVSDALNGRYKNQEQFVLDKNPDDLRRPNPEAAFRQRAAPSDYLHGNKEVDKQTPPNSDVKIPTEEKRRIFLALQGKVERGEELDTRQKQIYRLLYSHFGKEVIGQQPAPVDNQRKNEDREPSQGEEREGEERLENQAQVPPIQNVFVREGGEGVADKPANDEHEEVKDLIEEHQKPGEFENLGKEREQGGGGAGVPDGGGPLNNEDEDERDEFNEDDDRIDNLNKPGGEDDEDLAGEKKEGGVPIPNPNLDQAFNPNEEKDPENDYYQEDNDGLQEEGHDMFKRDMAQGLKERRRQSVQNMKEEMRRVVGREKIDEDNQHRLHEMR